MAVMPVGNPRRKTFNRFPSLTKNRIVLETLLENRRIKDMKMKNGQMYMSVPLSRVTHVNMGWLWLVGSTKF